MKFEAVTIKDIAKALGLSTSTVSRALRDSYEISPETKQAVLEYARQINYRPNPIALSLKEKRSRSIGVVVSEIANSFFSQAINGIESIAYSKGYHVIITQSLESYEREVMNMQFLSSRSVDGCLISISSETCDFSHLTELTQRGMPIVCFDRVVEGISCPKVTVDNAKGAYDATSHLIASGFKRIAFLANAEFLSITKARQAGYRKALEDHALPFDPANVQYCPQGGMRYDEVEAAVQALLSQTRKPDAIFASSDKLTTNCLRYFKKQLIWVPDDMGIIGFSNLDLTDLIDPPLSVVHQPAFEMGRVAAELLIRNIESKRPETYEDRVLPTEVLVRESSLKAGRRQ
jgi:DNA-binding LacI/PurR family transcriptional regulator